MRGKGKLLGDESDADAPQRVARIEALLQQLPLKYREAVTGSSEYCLAFSPPKSPLGGQAHHELDLVRRGCLKMLDEIQQLSGQASTRLPPSPIDMEGEQLKSLSFKTPSPWPPNCMNPSEAHKGLDPSQLTPAQADFMPSLSRYEPWSPPSLSSPIQ